MFKKGIPLSYFAWAALVVPLLTSHLSYLIAASYEHVPWCLPYWENCTSISATGRNLPEKLFFKFGMIFTAFNAMLLWWCAGQWFRQYGLDQFSRSRRAMQLLGVLAALFLIQYTMALGEVGGAYRLLRRTGVILTFSFTYIAQVLMTRLVGEVARLQASKRLDDLHRAMLVLLVVLLATGIFSLVLDVLLGPAYDRFEDAFEWGMALMLYLYFGLLARVWHRQPMNLLVGRVPGGA